jgi:hypothetical protein
MNSGAVVTRKRYFIPFCLEVLQLDRVVLHHDYSAAGRNVLIQLPVGTLGDPLGGSLTR